MPAGREPNRWPTSRRPGFFYYHPHSQGWKPQTTDTSPQRKDKPRGCCDAAAGWYEFSAFGRWSLSLPHVVHLQHLVPIVVDHLHRDLALLWRVEQYALGRVQLRPLGLIDLGAEGAFQLLVGVLAAEEVG